MKLGEVAEARNKLEESYRLDPSLGTLLNLALCEQRLGRVAAAWTHLHEFVAHVPADDLRLPLATRKLTELEPQLPWLRLVLWPDASGVTVKLDGVELPPARLEAAFPVDPGKHVIAIALPTHEMEETLVEVQLAESREVRLSKPLRRTTSAAPEHTLTDARSAPQRIDSPSTAPAVTQNASGVDPTVYVLGSAGVAGIVTSGIFGFLAWDAKRTVREHCSEHLCRDQTGIDAAHAGARYSTIATVSFVVGSVGLVGAGIVWARSANVRTSLAVGPGSASLSLTGAL